MTQKQHRLNGVTGIALCTRIYVKQAFIQKKIDRGGGGGRGDYPCVNAHGRLGACSPRKFLCLETVVHRIWCILRNCGVSFRGIVIKYCGMQKFNCLD